jgi:small subunit ribosomal protein S13
MARISGVDLPRNRNIETALTYIYGIGFTLSNKILNEAGIDKQTKVKDLKDDEIAKIRDIISKNYKVEGELRSQQAIDIKRLMEIGSYRGLRHKKGLPVRGQRTNTNARTRKGPRKTIGVKRGKKFLIRFNKFPLSNSAPLAIWALIIFSVSSIKVGIKRRAIVIIMAISCAGTLIIFKKDNIFSIPSVRAIGEVVRVSHDVDKIRKNSLTAINNPLWIPSRVIFSIHTL